GSGGWARPPVALASVGRSWRMWGCARAGRALAVQRPGRRCRVVPHGDLARLQAGEALGEAGLRGPDLAVRADQIDVEVCPVGESWSVHLRVPVLVEPGTTEGVHYCRQRGEH